MRRPNNFNEIIIGCLADSGGAGINADFNQMPGRADTLGPKIGGDQACLNCFVAADALGHFGQRRRIATQAISAHVATEGGWMHSQFLSMFGQWNFCGKDAA